MTGAASKAIAGCFALAAFTVAVLAGLAGGNSSMSILLRALIAMIACYPVGLLTGLVCQHIIEQHVRESGAATGQPGDAHRAAVAQNAENLEEGEEVIVV